MFIQRLHRSKVVIGLAMLCVVMFIALAVMRAGNTVAQQNVGGFSFSQQQQQQPTDTQQPSAPQQQPTAWPPANGGFGGPPPNNQNNSQNNPQQHPFRDGWAAPPNAVHPNNLAHGFPGPMSTAAPMTESDRRALEIANRIRQTRDNDEREQLRNQLRETLNAAFDQRRAQQLQEMEQLERQVDSIRKLDEKRQQRKEEIVQRRMSDLLSEPDALDWEPKRPEGQYGFPGPMPGSLPPGGLQPPRVSGFQASGQNQDSNFQRPLLVEPSFPAVDPNNPSEKADATTLPQQSSDAFTFQLTEFIMLHVERLRLQREVVKELPALSDKQSVHFSSIDARILASIENGRSIWRTIGKQKQRDVDTAAAALEHAKERLEIKLADLEKGNLAQISLMNDEAAVVFANANMAKAQDQLDGWKELDQRLQTAIAGAGLSDPATDAEEKPKAAEEEGSAVEPSFE